MKIEEEDKELSEINVTPFVDVMLVLLTIFMITAPLMKAGVEVDLPEAEGKVVEIEEWKSATIQVKEDGSIFLNEKRVQFSELMGILRNLKGKEIFLEGHRNVRYEIIAKILAEAKKAGVDSINLVTQLPSR